MPTTVDWFFDIIPPLAYLQLGQFDALQQANDVVVHPRSLVLDMILHHWGQKGPTETGAKRAFIYRHALFHAQQLGIPFRMPPAHPFNPIRTLRLTIAMSGSLDVVRAVFQHIWRDYNGVAPPEGFTTLCEAVGFAKGAATIEQPAVKDTLRAHTDTIITLGVFGVPILVHEDELFWGGDATTVFLQNLHVD